MNKEEIQKKDYHICVPIERALKELEKGNNLFEPATPLEAFHDLMTALDSGKKYYTGCDNEDSEGRCQGHKSNP